MWVALQVGHISLIVALEPFFIMKALPIKGRQASNYGSLKTQV
jgi:hypothetical protein